eukprot:4511427-Prymnesium_polylepis.1
MPVDVFSPPRCCWHSQRNRAREYVIVNTGPDADVHSRTVPRAAQSCSPRGAIDGLPRVPLRDALVFY